MSLESQPVSPVDSTTEFSVPLGIPAQPPQLPVEPVRPRTVDSINTVEHVSMRLAGRYRPQPNKKTKLAVGTMLVATTFAASAVSLSWLHFSEAAKLDSLASVEEGASSQEPADLSDLRHTQAQTPEKEKYRPHEELGIDLELRPVSDALVTAEDLIISPVGDTPPVHVVPARFESTGSKRTEEVPLKQSRTLAIATAEAHPPAANNSQTLQTNADSTSAFEVAASLTTTSETEKDRAETAAADNPAQPQLKEDGLPETISDDLDSLIETYRERYLSLKMDGGKQKRYGREYYAAVAELCVWVNIANQVPRDVENLVREVATDKDLRTLVQSAAFSWIRWPQRASDGVMVAGELLEIDTSDNATVLTVRTGHNGSKTVVINAVNGCDIEVGGRLIVLGMIQTAGQEPSALPGISGYVIGF